MHLDRRRQDALQVTARHRILKIELLIGQKSSRAKPGVYAGVPRGTVHQFGCVGDKSGRLLILFTPIDAAEIARTNVAGPRHGLSVVAREGESVRNFDSASVIILLCPGS